jgi:4-amino-4-deoxy-L-arabinose transferase-like glycosyltransferase
MSATSPSAGEYPRRARSAGEAGPQPGRHQRVRSPEVRSGSALVTTGAELNGSLALLRDREHAPAREPDLAPAGRGTWRAPWALLGVLALQAGISVTLIWSNSAFGDEAEYLWAGHMELQHWLHGVPIPNYNLLLSGSPMIYPPLAAIVNDFGGLSGARILSLMLMLGATALLYSTASRLFGRRAAIAAAALWAVSVSALKLGAFATFDAMAVFLMCLAVWLAVQATFRRRAPELVVLAALVMLLADLTAYSYAVYDPAIFAVAYFAWLPRVGKQRARELALWLVASALTLAVLIPTVMGLWGGIIAVTITRSGNSLNEDQGYLVVAQLAWAWSGLVALLGLAGAATAAAVREERRKITLLWVLAGSAFLVPLYQLHLQTGWALDKHLACGIWLAAMPAGYLISKIAQAPALRRGLMAVAATAALAIPTTNGWMSAYSDYQTWPNASPLIATVRPLVASPHAALFPGNVATWLLDYYTSSQDHVGPLWGTGPQLSIDPTNIRYSWPVYYKAQLALDNYSAIVLTFPVADTAFSMQPGSTALPGTARLRQDLAGLAAAEPWNAALFSLAEVIEADPRYELVGAGPYTSDLASGSYAVWKLR